MYFNPTYDENLFSDMNHVKSLPFAMPFFFFFDAICFTIETQEDTDFKINSKVLYKLTQPPQRGKLFREEHSVD